MLRYTALLLLFTALLGAECPKELLKLNKTSKEFTQIQNNQVALKTGWNYLHRSESGVDIIKSFANRDISSVCVYDNETKKWAKFPKTKGYLSLEKTGPNTSFYIYANKKIKTKVNSTYITSTCKKLIKDKNYDVLTDSGTDDAMVYNSDKTMVLKSRYRANYIGKYSDTRVSMIYPKLKASNKKLLKYGPARPRSYIEYAKEYEEKEFYMFDYRSGKCYKGFFPSRKIPPFASLTEMK